MIDVEKLKAQLDLRQLVERDLGKPHFRGRDYAAFKCPLHSEHKGYSLVVYADHWRCYGKCQIGGDAIAWVQQYHQLSFQEACSRLATGDLPQVEGVNAAHRTLEPMAQPPDERWQQTARYIINEARERLWSEQGRRALAYLREMRGLNDDIIRLAQLGYIPGAPTEWQQIDGLHVPCGITLPWVVDNVVWGVKVRRAAGEQRYQQVSGGRIRSSLYLADQVQPGLPLIITEGEFDALIALQVGWHCARAVAIGSASHARIDRRWYGKLLTVPRIIVCMDVDMAGANAARQLALVSSAVKCVQVPLGKDMNEFDLRAGGEAVCAWLEGMAHL